METGNLNDDWGPGPAALVIRDTDGAAARVTSRRRVRVTATVATISLSVGILMITR